jgi:very-short-patch-repair endonuclease
MRKRRHYRGGFQFSGQKTLTREFRKKETPAEELLWQLLRNRQVLGFKFRRQHQFGDYIADFYCREADLAIECDGAVHGSNERWQHDQERHAYMISQGLKVLRFSNHRVLNDTGNVVAEICQALNPGPSPNGEGRKTTHCSLQPKALTPALSQKGEGEE